MAWACGTRVGDGDELDVERPDADPLAVGAPATSSVLPSRPASSMRLRARPSVSAEPYTGHAQLAQQELDPADVVLVAVGGDDRLDPRRRCSRR